MRAITRCFGALVVLAAMLMAIPIPQAGAQEALRLVEVRTIEAPDTMRIQSISPDGSGIAATDFERLCVYETETMAERACADLDPLQAEIRIEDIVWSPDSSQIALAEEAFKVFVDGDLWVMDAFTGELTNLTDDGVEGRLPVLRPNSEITAFFIDVSPAWLPDGSGITFSWSAWRDGEWEGTTIETVTIKGGGDGGGERQRRGPAGRAGHGDGHPCWARRWN